ncbi:unnamed protein product [Paramecium sonneborni]|uniref:Transmembrane protein n=1 Tax=Paramecium sonneborni TaxID=65129 RepID=A0A8S1P6R1_9CILI|nr:unnamed protein product [Paramecium sonneborni]
MNKYSLRFDNPKMEELYFQDQFEELFNFYTWACCLGTISAICVFTMEFIIPFGFGVWKYTLIMIPLGFVLSHRLIKYLPQYFNPVLAAMNISLGGLIFILLYFFSDSNILFLAGQTVVMIQYSLLLGSNIVINILVLLINQIGLMILSSIVQNYFNSLQLMFILALALVLKAVWSSEKMKRSFFLLKHQNIQLHKQLDNVFQLKIIRCKFDKKLNQLKLVNINKQAEKIIQDQKQFLQFIRQYSVVLLRSLSQPFQVLTSSQRFMQKSQTLEQILYNMLEGEDKEKSSEIYSEITKIAYRICIYKIIEKNQVQLIMLLQEDNEYLKILKLNKEVSKKNRNQRLLMACLEYAKKSLHLIKYLSSEIVDKNQKMHSNSIINFKTIKIIQNTQGTLFKSIHGYYNVLILNSMHQKFQETCQFKIMKLLNDLQQLRCIFCNVKQLPIYFEGDNIECESNYVLSLQLILNILQEFFLDNPYKSILIKTELLQYEQTKVVNYKIHLFVNENLNLDNSKNRIIANQFYYLKKVNKKIMKIIGWNNQITVINENNYLIIEYDLLHSLKEFKEAIKK